MNPIFILTLLATLALGFGRVFVKLSSSFLHPLLGLVLMQITMLAVGLILFLINYAEIKTQIFQISRPGLLFIVLSGLILAGFDALVFYAFKSGGKVALFAPITSGGAILITLLLGILFVGERITTLQFAGILITTLGVIMISL